MYEGNLKTISPRPVEGRARNYGYERSLSNGRLGAQMGGSLEISNFLH